MRAKDIAFVAEVLANEVEYAAPGEAVGMLAATGAIRASIVERQPDADVTALEAVEDALAGLLYAPGATESDEQAAPVAQGHPGPERGSGAESGRDESTRLAARIARVEALIAVVDRTGPEVMKVVGIDALRHALRDAG